MQYGPMVLRRCRQLLRDEGAALDAMQDVFLKVLDNPACVDIQYPSSFLYTVATRNCLDMLRRAKTREGSGSEALEDILADDDMESRLTARRFLDKLFRREDNTRAMAVMHWVDGMSLREVAEQVGMSVSGVRRRLDGLKQRVQHEQ